MGKETLISGIEVVLLFTLLHYFCHFLSFCGTYLCVYMINCEFDFAIFAKRQTNIFQDDASACIKCTLKDVQKIKKKRKSHQKQNSWKISLCKYFHMEIFPHRKFPPGNHSIILLLLNFLSFILIFIEKKYHYLMCSFLMSKLL